MAFDSENTQKTTTEGATSVALDESNKDVGTSNATINLQKTPIDTINLPVTNEKSPKEHNKSSSFGGKSKMFSSPKDSPKGSPKGSPKSSRSNLADPNCSIGSTSVFNKKYDKVKDEKRKQRDDLLREIPLKLTPINPKEVILDIALDPAIYIATVSFFSYMVGVLFGNADFVGFLGFIIVVGLTVVTIAANEFKQKRRVRNSLALQADQLRHTQYPHRESAEWINGFINIIFQNFPKTVETLVLQKVNPEMEKNRPPALTELSLQSFKLGQSPPLLSNLMFFQQSKQEVSFDCDLDWDADFEIVINVGLKAMPKMTFKVGALKLHARARIYIRLLPDKQPYASYMFVQLQETPDFDITIKNMLEISAIPGLIPLVKNVLDKILKDMLVAPKYFPINFAEMYKIEVSKEDMLPEEDHIKEGGGIKGMMKGAGGAVLGGVGAVGSGLASGVGAVGGGVVSGVGAVGGGAIKGVTAIGGGTLKGVSAVGGGFKKVGGTVFGSSSKISDSKNASQTIEVIGDSASSPVMGSLDNERRITPEEEKDTDKEHKREHKKTKSFSFFGHKKKPIFADESDSNNTSTGITDNNTSITSVN